MAGTDRKEEQVRRLLAGPRPPVPPDLAELAAVRGRRLLRRRRALRDLFLALVLAGTVLFTAWAVTTQPWQGTTSRVTPPGHGW